MHFNVQQVLIETGEKPMRVFIEANPQYKNVTVYSDKMQRLSREQREGLMQKPTGDVNRTTSQQKDLAQEGQGGKKQTAKKEPEGLIKKTRERKKGKGLGV